MTREIYRSLPNTSADSKAATFVILISHASAPVRKERLSPTSRVSKEASRNKFVKKGGIPVRDESYREVDRSKNRPRIWQGFAKAIRNELKTKFDRK